MRVFDFIARFFGATGNIVDLAQAEAVVRLVPGTAEYVTAGLVAVVADVRAFNKGDAGKGPFGRDLGYLPADMNQQPALLVLSDGRVSAVGREQVLWSCDVRRILALDGHRRGGFLVVADRPDGLAVSQQTPVERPNGALFKTLEGTTNVFGGWDKALQPYGTAHYF